jgi:hypothetical protein
MPKPRWMPMQVRIGPSGSKMMHCGAGMHDLDYVVDLAKAYGRALITRDELRDEIHCRTLEDIMYGVIVFSEDYGDDAAAAFVLAADFPIVWERWFTRAELDSDPETS